MKKLGLLMVAAAFGCMAIEVGLAEEGATPEKPIVGVRDFVQINGIMPVDIAKLKSGEGTLNVGHYNQLPPFYFDQGSPQLGFGYDIFMEVAKKAGIQNVKFVGFDNSADLNAELRQGKIDVIANAWDLPGTRKNFLLTAPYYTQGGLSFLYFKKNGSFKTLDDIKNHNIGVFKRGYADHYWLPAHGIPKTAIRPYLTLKELMFALKDGHIDVAVVYYPLARLAQQQLTNQLDSTLIQPINDVYALRKQDLELQTVLNEAIQSLVTDGSVDKIQAQYLDPSPSLAEEKAQV